MHRWTPLATSIPAHCCDDVATCVTLWLATLELKLIINSATRQRAPLTHRLWLSLKAESSAYRIPDARCAGLAARVARVARDHFDLAYRIAKSKKFRRLSL